MSDTAGRRYQFRTRTGTGTTATSPGQMGLLTSAGLMVGLLAIWTLLVAI